jgi:Zn ribbon nucleic-acid-binding protein
MANKKQYKWQDSEYFPYTDIKTNYDEWEKTEKTANEALSSPNRWGTQKAIDYTSSGRDCPRCANRLHIREATQNGTLILECYDCHGTWHNTDLEAITEIDENGKVIDDVVTDGMYRRIDTEMVNRWMTYFAEHKMKKD